MSASTLAVDVDTLRHKFQIITDAERDRHEFVESLLQQIETLHHEREEVIKALRAKELLAVTYQDRFEATEKRFNEYERAIDCDKFVLVVIDGDNTLFCDDYVREGLKGGEKAARELQQALFNYFRDKEYFKHDHRIVVRIYVNLLKLSEIYNDAKITPNPTQFQHFVQGFNKTHSLTEIIDAGNVKEGADSKVKAEFDLFRRNLQCQQIVLAGSGDNGYGGLLRPYAPSSDKSKKITLIEALPFVRELQALSDKFETVSFTNIFRDTKIVTKGTSSHEDVSRDKTPSTASAPVPKASSVTPPATYATKALRRSTASASDNTNETSITTQEQFEPALKTETAHIIYVNNLDQRVDIPIKNLNRELANRLKQRKFCNAHYLRQNCSYNFCPHAHEPSLSPTDLEHLRYVARLKRCSTGLKCRKPECYDGHQCPSGMSCSNHANGKCRFSDEMHRVESGSRRAITVGV